MNKVIGYGIGIMCLCFLLGCQTETTITSTNNHKKPKTSQGKGPFIKDSPRKINDSQYTRTSTGLQYYDIVEGDGEQPKQGQLVEVDYTGWLTNGKKFDSSVDRGRPLRFPIGVRRVILGWDEGVLSMKVGGYRQLVIPSRLAYGEQGAGEDIPPNATLIFEVKLLKVQ